MMPRKEPDVFLQFLFDSTSASDPIQHHFIAMSLVPSSIQVPCRSVQGPSPTTWAKYRETITRLYIREDKSLAEIMDIMARHHGLHAT